MKNNKRYFAFGCSYVSYDWLTLADLIGSNFDEYYNFGKPGGSNEFSWDRLLEAHLEYKFNPNTDFITFGVTNPTRYHFIREEIIGNKCTNLIHEHSGNTEPGTLLGDLSAPGVWSNKFENYSFALNRTYKSLLATRTLLDLLGIEYTVYNSTLYGSNKLTKDCQRKVEYDKVQSLIDIQESIDHLWAASDNKTSGFQFDNGKSDGHHRPEIHFKYLEKYFPVFYTEKSKEVLTKYGKVDSRSREDQRNNFWNYKNQAYIFYAH